MNPNTSIVEKIQKLQALADRAGTEAEAALAAQRVAELCQQHNLDIGVARLSQEETEATEAQHEHEGKRWQAHWNGCAAACAALFGVGYYRKPVGIVVKNSEGFVVARKEGRAIVFYGLKASVLSAKMTYHYLIASVESLLEGYLKDPETPALVGVSDFRSFRMGCASRISHEASKAKESKQQHLQAASEVTALVRLEGTLIAAHRKKMQLRSGGSMSGAAKPRPLSRWLCGWRAGRSSWRTERQDATVTGDPRFDNHRYPFDRPQGSPPGLVLADCGHMARVGTLEPVVGQELCPACYAKRLAEVKRAIAPEALDEDDIEQARRTR